MTENLPAVKQWSEKEVSLIKSIAAPKCNDEEFGLLMYQARVLNLDPLQRQIWAIKYTDNKPASIFVGRDGYLAIAHQSGQFDGIESGSNIKDGDTIGWAKVYRKDMTRPICVEVSLKEYDKHQGNWNTMPRTMIQKVAESQALRRAFNISGVYSPEELIESEKPPMKDITPEDHEGMICIHDPTNGDVWVEDPKKHGKKK